MTPLSGMSRKSTQTRADPSRLDWHRSSPKYTSPRKHKTLSRPSPTTSRWSTSTRSCKSKCRRLGSLTVSPPTLSLLSRTLPTQICMMTTVQAISAPTMTILMASMMMGKRATLEILAIQVKARVSRATIPTRISSSAWPHSVIPSTLRSTSRGVANNSSSRRSSK